MIDGTRVVAGNVGDSRAVISRDGSAVALTDDHKANRPDEIARIVNAGGWMHTRACQGGCHALQPYFHVWCCCGSLQVASLCITA